MGYFINKSNTEDHERLKQIDVAQKNRLEQDKVNEANLEKRLQDQLEESKKEAALRDQRHVNTVQTETKSIQSQDVNNETKLPEKKVSKYSKEEWLAICKSSAKTAKAIMTKRQAGVPMSEMMDKVVATADNNIKEMLRTLVVSAYSEHAYGSEDVQSKTITEFENRTYVNCLKAEDK